MDLSIRESSAQFLVNDYQMLMENDGFGEFLMGNNDEYYYTNIEHPLGDSNWLISNSEDDLDYSNARNSNEEASVDCALSTFDRFPTAYSKNQFYSKEPYTEECELMCAMHSDEISLDENYSNFAGSQALLNVFDAETVEYVNDQLCKVLPSPVSPCSTQSDDRSSTTATTSHWSKLLSDENCTENCVGYDKHFENGVLSLYEVNVFEKLIGGEYGGRQVVGRPSFYSSSAGLNSCVLEVNGAIGTRDQECSENCVSIFRVSLRGGFVSNFQVCDKLEFITDLEWIDRRHLAVSHGTGSKTKIDMFFLDKKLKSPLCNEHKNEIREMSYNDGKLLSVGYDGLVVLTDVHRASSIILNKRELPASPHMCFSNEVIGSVRWRPNENFSAAITFDGHECDTNLHKSWAMIDLRTYSVAMTINTLDCVYTSEFLNNYKIALGTEFGGIMFYDIRKLLGECDQSVNVMNIVGDLHFHQSTQLLAAWGEPGMSVGSMRNIVDDESIPWQSVVTGTMACSDQLNIQYGSFIPSQRDAYVCTNGNSGIMKLIKIPDNQIFTAM